MPNIQSAKKRMRLSKRQTNVNKMVKTELKTAVKKAQLALEENAENRDELVGYAVKRIDMAVSKGVLHKNTAARKKSNLVTALNKAS